MARPTVRSRKVYKSYIEAFVLAIVLGILIRFFLITPYKIPSSAMIPTLLSGDYVFVYRPPYGLQVPWGPKIGSVQNPQRGDVVLFSYPKSPETKFIKRIIAIEGDKVFLQNSKLFINGQLVEKQILEPMVLSNFKSKDTLDFYSETLASHRYHVAYLKEGPESTFGPITIPPGEVFVLGDNRDGSDDSRYWGTVPQQNLEGKVVLIWFSFNIEQMNLRWDRFLSRIY